MLHSLPAGDWADGERGIACLPERVGEFQDGLGKAIGYAQALQCPQLNYLAGIAASDADPAKLRDTMVRNPQFAATELKSAGIRLLVEPCNTRDIPGFYLNRSQQAIELIDAVGSDNLFLQYDIFHMRAMEGYLAPTIGRHLDRIRHLQLADNPGRGEPGTGEINYPFLFAFIDELGYLRLDRLRIQARQRYRAGPRLDQTLPVTQERA